MAEAPTQPKAKGIQRLQIGLNLLVQLLLILFLIISVNWIGFRHYKRWDVSRDQKYALSDKTKRFLHTVKGKIRITVFFSPNTPISGDVASLLTEYQYAAKGKIDIENIDPQRNLSRAKELFDKYKVVSDESLLIIDYDGRNKTAKASEMAEIDQSGMAMGEGPRVTAFKGEQVITSAMMDLVEGKKNVIGYVTGHKEPSIAEPSPLAMMQQQQQPERSPVSVMKTFIENENIKFQELNLYNEPQIPADVKTVMIAGPQYDLSDREIKLLHDFWDKQGRILLLLDPSAKTPKLDAFLNELGLKVNDDRLMAFVRTEIDFEDETHMAERAIGLLTKKYDSKMFSRSPNGRWVIYERYSFPCLIDTTTSTEELIGWSPGSNRDKEMPPWWYGGNSPVDPDQARWHATNEAVALSVGLSRRATSVWIWEHQHGVQKLTHAEMIKLLHPKGKTDEPNPITAEFKEWKGDDLLVSVSWGMEDEGAATIAWNVAKHQWRVVSRDVAKKER